MSTLLHRVKVFVYCMSRRQPKYLLLKRDHGIEACWGPLQGPIEHGEKLESAIRREVMETTGIAPPRELIDLRMPVRWVVGDEEVVEWHFGFRTDDERRIADLDPCWSEFRWEQFPAAYPSLELEPNRAAIMRLHTLLGAA